MFLPVTKIASGFAALAANVVTTGQPPLSAGASAALVPILSTTGTAATATSALLSTSPFLLQNMRGGAAATNAVLNLSRENLFLQGIGTYGTITALIMNASLRMWTSTSFKKEQNVIVPSTFNIATILCIMSGAFTAILFQLLTIYSKSALGMGNDTGYIAFKTATETFRLWGFRCFLTQMVSFVVVFLSRLYNLLWENARERNRSSVLTNTGKCILGGSFLLMVMGSILINAVLGLASQHVFC